MTLEEYVKKYPPSMVTKELIRKLQQFSKDDDYILGVLAESPYDVDRQLIIDYIEYGEDVDYCNVILFSMEVGLKREQMEAENKE